MAQNDITALIEQLNNGLEGNPDAEWQAAIALGNVEDESDKTRAAEALVSLLEAGTAHALTRAHAVEALGKLAHQAATTVLLNAAQNDDYQLVRAYAIGSLTVLENDASTVTAMLDIAANDVFFGARAQAIAAATYIALRIDDATLIQQVRDTLNNRRTIESSQNVQGIVRIIAEIDRSLVAIDEHNNE